MNIIKLTLFSISILICSKPSFANWTFNVGYHNPRDAKLGVNLLYWGSQWNFELGLGWLDGTLQKSSDTNEDNKEKLGVAALGDLNLKYRFTTGTIAPYVQIGVGAATAASIGEKSGVGADLGGAFLGLGLML